MYANAKTTDIEYLIESFDYNSYFASVGGSAPNCPFSIILDNILSIQKSYSVSFKNELVS